MAGAVYQVRSTLAKWGVTRLVRMTLVTILALNAMFVYYGGNGMSEGLYLFSLLATCRYLLRWLRRRDLHSLVYSAVALGVCYLARNEAVGAAVLGGLVVLGVTSGGSSATGWRRVRAGLDDLIVFEIPFTFAFVGWAIVSYVITGSPFQQFTSVYGTTSQIKVAGSVDLNARILQDIHDVFYLAPAIPVVVLVAAYFSLRRRYIGLFAPLAVVGGVLGFDLLAYIHNLIQPWFRYFITAVPLDVLLVGSLFATVPALLGPAKHSTPVRWTRTWLAATLATLIALAFVAPSSATTIMGMANPRIGYEETQHLGYIFFTHPTSFEEEAPATYPAMIQKMAAYFAREHLASGQVVVDNFSGCTPNVILASPNPKIFVIPNDRDFQRTLADPLGCSMLTTSSTWTPLVMGH